MIFTTCRRQLCLPLVWLALFSVARAVAGAAGESRPNLILILADDMGYADPACFGGTAVPTPHLDALARSGTKLTRFYAASAVCTPTRAAILTGRYPLRFDIRKHFPDDESHLPRGVVTLPGLLRSAGYVTAHVGKWHLGGLHLVHARERARSIPGPREHGFERYLAQNEEPPLRSRLGRERRLYRDGGTCLLRDDAPVPPSDPYYRQHLTDILGAEAIRVVEDAQRQGKPFFLNLWHLVPHAPYEPGSEPHFSRTAAPGLSEDQHCFRSMVAHLDATIGQLLARLDQLGLRRNTLVVFASDNGGAFEADVGGLKGGKTDLHEGGIRVPMIASWPGKIPAGVTRDQPASAIDLLPTLCAAAAVAVPATAKVDGIDLLPHLRDGREVGTRGPMFWQIDLYRAMQRHTPKPEPFATEAVIEGRWKLLTRDGQPLELFNLMADPGETKNLFGTQVALEARLSQAVRAFLAEPRDRSGFPVQAGAEAASGTKVGTKKSKAAR
jgi:arylsulfatase A-like enzyme